MVLPAHKVLQYKELFKKEAEDLLLSGFPSTILKLNALIATPQFKKRSFSEMHEYLRISNILLPPCDFFENGDSSLPPPKKKLKPSNSPNFYKTNKFLIDLIETVKPHMIKLVEDSKIMKMWISFLIPKIEDGNNFGVEIQEETLALVQAVENSAALFYERILNYFNQRAKIIKNISKYPEVEDYKRAVLELDEKEYLCFCLVLSEIRNQYCALHDVFLKNLDKLKRPRSNQSAESLY